MMEIPPLKQSSNIKSTALSEITQTWKVGQILNGTTQRGGEALSKVLIKVGQQTLEAKTPIPLKDGQEVKLLVKTSFEGGSTNPSTKLPILSILNAANVALKNSDMISTKPNNIAGIKLRQFISTQQSFSQVQELAKILTSDKKNQEKLPTSLKILLNNVQNSLQVKAQNISAIQLKQLILNSGIFLESKIIQQSSSNTINNNLANDFKYQLLAIKSALIQFIPDTNSNEKPHQHVLQVQSLINQTSTPLRNTQLTFLLDKLITLLPKSSLIQLSNLLNGPKPNSSIPNDIKFLEKIIAFTFSQQSAPHLKEQINYQLLLLELSQQIEQAISRVTSLQLQPLSRESDNMFTLLFNLVFKDSNDRFDMEYRIQDVTEKQNDEESKPDEQSWSVILDFNFKTLGKVQSKISLTGNQISNTFNTEYNETAKKIHSLLPLLESSLTKAGLNITHLSVKNTLVNKTTHTPNVVNLLDENA